VTGTGSGAGRGATRAAGLLRVRWFVRAPIRLYRARLGVLFGSRLLMLEHRGRVSGERRFVVLEVVDRPRPGSFVVASGFGAKAQWLRNVRADPHVRVYTGSRKPAAALARELTPDERAQTLRGYAARHPRAWQRLRPVFESTLGTRIDEQGTSLPMIELRLTGAALR
jgi:deazaflavin-dependent oxidoreductase (nitroreductase family)